MLRRIQSFGEIYRSLSDEQLRQTSQGLGYRVRCGETPTRVLPEAFALVREAASRTLRLRHYDVQLFGGWAMAGDAIVQMQTGEGKTLTATLPLYLHGLAGKGAHLATVNDYLATRDADWNRPLFELLGLSVGVVTADASPRQRQAAYRCDITYGTAKEFGFDFLKDRLTDRAASDAGRAASAAQRLQRRPHFVLVDEADSVLIDDARTPLLISAEPDDASDSVVATYQWAARHADRFQDQVHYVYDRDKQSVELTFAGRHLVRCLPRLGAAGGVAPYDLYEYMERAIRVARDFHPERHYVVKDGEVVLVDESTGRIAEGRRFSRGIHQAIEADAGVQMQADGGHAARITVQDFFRRYRHLAGMTGTALSARREFRRVYRAAVVSIPTHRQSRRRCLPTRSFAQEQRKLDAMVEQVARQQQTGRPVLIGTRTIEKSEQLSQLLTERQIEHQVLNAHRAAEEAEIIAQAGQLGKVTVATNMAGRGTDIRLGPGVAELGGLLVIATELHDSPRIDRQLAGRCARQGDPGEVCQYVSAEDALLKDQGRRPAPFSGLTLVRQLKHAQRQASNRQQRQRRVLLHQERQRNERLCEMGLDPYLDSLD